MKQAIGSFLNKPLVVIITSLVIAGGIGTYEYAHINSSGVQGVIPDNSSLSTQNQNGHLTLSFLASGKINTVAVKVGDTVKKGDILATLDPENTEGAMTQAKAAYDSANANYQKILNGATGPTIDAARVSVNNAKSNLDQVNKQQDVLVSNAYKNLLNSTPEAKSDDPGNANNIPPTIGGSYVLGQEGDIVIETYGSQTSSGLSIKISGLVNDNESVTSLVPTPIGNSGLTIQFPDDSIGKETWIISIPNKQASDYVSNLNAYQLALQTQTQTIAAAQSTLDQANSNFEVVVAVARPEDAAIAKAAVDNAYGALQIAQSAFNNREIISPSDGTVSAVYITIGESTSQNIPAIELSDTNIK